MGNITHADYTTNFSFKRILTIALLFLGTYAFGQLGQCNNNNNGLPPYTVAQSTDPNYLPGGDNVFLDINIATITPGGEDFCIGNDPGVDTEGGCGTFLFTGLDSSVDGCPVEFCFTPKQGCGNALGNVCIWVEDPDNPGDWLNLGGGSEVGEICIQAPPGVSEFALTICRPGMGPVNISDVTVNLPPTITLPADQTECETDLPKIIDLTSFEPAGQMGGTWTVNGAPVTDPAAYALNGVNGDMFTFEYTYDASNEVGFPCMVSDEIKFTINDDCCVEPDAPLIDVVDATCDADGSATITNYDAALTYTFDPAGPSVGAGGVISGFDTDTAYTVTAENAPDCSTESAPFTIGSQLGAPDAPTVTVVDATCDAAGSATITNYDAALTYTFDPAGPSVGAGGVVSGFDTDTEYTVTAENADGCVAESAPFTIGSQLGAPDAPTVTVVDATCDAAGSATITNYDAALTYTFDPAGPSVGAGGVVSGFDTDTEYTVTAENADGCVAESAPFTIGSQLGAPDAPTVTVVDATCDAAGSATITNYDAALTYTFDPAGPSVGAGGVVSGFDTDTEYTVTAENADGCVAESAPFTIGSQLGAPDAPTVTVVDATCDAAGSATITNYDAALTYTFDPAGPSVGAGGVVSGFDTDTEYTVTAENADGCVAESAPFTIGSQLGAPDAPTVTVVDATCDAAGSATITNYDAALTYTFDPAGPSVGAGGVVSGFDTDTEYTVTAENADGCVAESAPFTIGSQLGAPDAPTVTVVDATCDAAGSATITNYDAALTYTFDPAGPSVGAGGVVSGFDTDTEYTVTAENADGCVAESAPFTIGSQLGAPDAPTVTVVDATCDAGGSATITNYDAALIYTFDPAGPSVGAGGVISGFDTDTEYTVTAENADGCVAESAPFTIGSQLGAPDAPTVTVVDATCDAGGSATITNYDAALTYTFDPAGPSVGAGGVISGFDTDTEYTVTAENADGCVAESAPFTIGSQLGAPDAPTVTVVDATCDAGGSATITNYDAALTYTFDPAGPSVGAGGVISGFDTDTAYTVTAENADGCVAESAPFTIGSQLGAPDAPTVTVVDATCDAGGSATITNYDAALTYTFDPAGPSVGAGGVISGFDTDTAYTVTAENADGCVAESAPFTIGSQLGAPDAPTVTVVDATCDAGGSATITNYDAALTYTFDPAGPSVGAGGVISGFDTDTAYTVTAENADGCVAESAPFTIGSQLGAPDAPTVTVVDATCDAGGSATITNYDAALIYTFDPAGPSVGAGGVISGFDTDTAYTVTAENADGCVAESAPFTIGSQLGAPDAPTVTVVDATCDAGGSATITNYDAALTYTFDPAGPSVGAGGVISGFDTDTAYTVTAENADGCVAESAPFTIGSQLGAPDAPTVTVVDATCDAGGSATITNYDAALTYTFDPAGPSVGAGGVISGFDTDTEYTVTAENADGCVAESAPFTIGSQLGAPDAPTVTVVDATCDAGGSATITNYDAALTYTFDPAGPSVGAGGVISGFDTDTAYTVTAENADGCVAESAPFTIGSQLGAPDAPTVTVVDATCDAGGSATITNYDAALTYTFDPAGPSVGAGGVISGFDTDTEYTVTAENADGCVAESAPFTIGSQLGAPDAPTVTVVDATCDAGGSATITNYDAALTYTFDPAGPSVGAGGVISGFDTDTEYTVTAENADGCVAESAPFTIGSQLDAPEIPVIMGDTTYCYDGNGVVLDAGAGYASYLWSPGGETTQMITVTSGAYTVTVTNEQGCEATSEAIVINSYEMLSCSIVQDELASSFQAADGVATVNPMGGSMDYTYLWDNGETTQTATALTYGTHSVIVTDAECGETTCEIFINKRLICGISLVSEASCAGADGAAIVTAFGGFPDYTYLWDNGETTAQATALSAGMHTVTVTDSTGAETTCSIEVPGATAANLSCSIEQDQLASNYLADDGVATVTGMGGSGSYTYLWDNGETTQTAVSLTYGNHTVTVVDSNGCGETTCEIFIRKRLICGINLDAPVSSSGASDGRATVTAYGGYADYTYLWDNGETTRTATALNYGTHTVTVTDSVGATTQCSILVPAPDDLSCSITQDQLASNYLADDGVATVTGMGGSGGYTYLWDNGETSATATMLTYGDHSVTVRDSSGQETVCEIFISKRLICTVNLDSPAACAGGADGAATVTAYGGYTPYTYSWDGGPFTDNPTNSELGVGDHTVTVMDSTGVTSSCQVSVTGTGELSCSITQDVLASNYLAEDGVATVNPIGGSNSYTYLWDNGETTQTATMLTYGPHTVTVTDTNGCGYTSCEIFVNKNLICSVGQDAPANCAGSEDGVATVTGYGGHTPYMYSWDGGDYTSDSTNYNLGVGNHTVTIKDATGATSECMVTISGPNELSVNINVTNYVSTMGGSDGSATAIGIGGTAPYSYVWNNGMTTDAIDGLISGTYSVAVTDSNGCTSSLEVTITEEAGTEGSVETEETVEEESIEQEEDLIASEPYTDETVVKPYPVYFVNELNLSIDIKYEAKVKVRLFDMNGRVVMKDDSRSVVQGANNLRFDVGRLASDVYILILDTGRERIVTKVASSK